MKILGIDFAWGKVNPSDARKAGYTVIIRYLSHDATKNITASELKADLAAGEDVVVVWESTSGNATKGGAAGRADAQAAVAQLAALHAPTHGAKPLCIYFAVDQDVEPGAVWTYFQAASALCHAAGYRCGVYGSARVVSDIVGRKLADLAWQTAAWSHGSIAGVARLYQDAKTVRVSGVTVDVDEIRSPDYGGWRAAAAPKPVKKPLPVFTYRRPLRKGMTGRDVAQLKARLRAMGYSSVPGPIFGRGLDGSVRRFQRQHRLAVDGVVGPATAKAINAAK